MFESLADRMKEDLKQEVNTTERAVKAIVVVVLSIVLFGGLYFVVRALG